MLQKKLAAQILKCSKNKIVFDTSSLTDIKEAITKQDVRRLIKTKVIKRKPDIGTSRVRARKHAIQKAKGRRKGVGSRKGKKTARTPKKRRWMNAVRVQRRLVKKLKIGKIVSPKDYTNLYRKVKGGFFRSTRHIKLYIKEKGLVK